MNRKKVTGFLGLVQFILSILLAFLINHQTILIVISAIVMIITSYLAGKKETKSLLVLWITTILFIMLGTLWLSIQRIVFFDLLELMLVINYVTVWIKSLQINKTFKSKNIFKVILIAIPVILSCCMVLFLNDAKILGTYMQGKVMKSENITKYPKETTKTLDKKYLLTNDIVYGSKYPNSYLAILKSKKDNSASRPTMIYMHGGGFVGGEALAGDPNAAKTNTAVDDYKRMVNHGYNVVTINYALAPQYIHPVPVIQMSQAIKYLQNNAKKLKLNMNEVVIGGGSAGGHIAGEFTVIQVNPAYAKRVGIKPVLKPNKIKALIMDSAAIDVNRGAKTQAPNIMTDYVFAQALGSYTGGPAIGFDKNKVKDMNLLTSVNSKMPPTFISDGNYGTFSDQARDYYHELKDHHVKTELYIPSPKEGRTGHGYMAKGSDKFSIIYNQKKYKFLKEALNS